MDGYDYLRIVNSAVAIVCLVLLALAFKKQRKTWNTKTHDHWWALSGWVFLAAYAAIENLVLDNPGGSRVLVQSLVIALTVRALLRRGNITAKPALDRHKEEEL